MRPPLGLVHLLPSPGYTTRTLGVPSVSMVSVTSPERRVEPYAHRGLPLKKGAHTVPMEPRCDTAIVVVVVR